MTEELYSENYQKNLLKVLAKSFVIKYLSTVWCIQATVSRGLKLNVLTLFVVIIVGEFLSVIFLTYIFFPSRLVAALYQMGMYQASPRPWCTL